MKIKKSSFILSVLIVGSIVMPLFAQKNKQQQIIFAVLNKGQTLEPIVQIENGKFVESKSGEDGSWLDFVKTYYKPKTSYNLIFGGSSAGKVIVNKADAKAECGGNIAEVSAQTTKAKLGGMVMALATNAAIKTANKGLRRMPTAAERTEIEKLVRAEFTVQKISATVLKSLRSHNLTALDVDNDGQAELVGTYWVMTSKNERGLLFFIAEKNKSGKYAFGHKEYQAVKNDDVMSGDVKDLDGGIYHELLLDVFDTDGDGISEVFTMVQAFEGNNFHVYRREAGKWTRALETYNYHCAY